MGTDVRLFDERVDAIIDETFDAIVDEVFNERSNEQSAELCDGTKTRAFHERQMRRALYWAHKAELNGDVPIGAVVVKDGRVIAHGYNRREQKQDIVEHAELMAIRQAMRKLKTWRLDGCTVYVTLEPCFMCAAALQQARVEALCFGSRDPKGGAVTSLCQFYDTYPLNHQVQLLPCVLSDDCSTVLKTFFRRRRLENKRLIAEAGGRGQHRQLKAKNKNRRPYDKGSSF